jgi:hypothetical protein
MSMTRGRPGSPGVRHGKTVGPDYPEANYINPWNKGIDEDYGSETEKSLDSMNSTTLGFGGAPLHEGQYNKLWEGK